MITEEKMQLIEENAGSAEGGNYECRNFLDAHAILGEPISDDERTEICDLVCDIRRRRWEILEQAAELCRRVKDERDGQ